MGLKIKAMSKYLQIIARLPIILLYLVCLRETETTQG